MGLILTSTIARYERIHIKEGFSNMEKLEQAISDILDTLLGYDRQPDGTFAYEIDADYRDEPLKSYSPFMFPSTMYMTLVHFAATLTSWVTSMIVVPSEFNFTSSSITSSE